jgi:predicted DNA-binding ribbon-helix-helix protein
MTIAGHQTSISLEPMFWAALEEEARRQGKALSAMVAEAEQILAQR